MNDTNINNSNYPTNVKQEQGENQINLAELWFKILDHWYYFVIAVIVALIVALFVNRYSTPKYEATASMLIKTNNDMLGNLNINTVMMRNRSDNDFQNSIGNIQSFTMTKRVVKAMGLYCDYLEKINFKNVDIYKNCPFEVILDPEQETQPTEVLIKINLASSDFCYISYAAKLGVPVYNYTDDMLEEKKASIPERNMVKLNYGQWYDQDGMKFKVILNKDWNKNMGKIDYGFKINDMDRLATRFNSTKIDLINKESSIVTIKFRHPNQKKAVDFVNMLCKIYIDQTFEEKNYLNVATINFVNSQINSIGDSLSRAESRKEAFQQASQTLNLTNDGQYLYTKTNELQTKRAEEYTKQQYYIYLADYLNKSGIDEGVASPAVMGVNDPVLNTLIGELSAAIIEHKTAVERRTEKNPKTKELQVRIETIRKQIGESLKNLRNISDINMRELQRQQNALQIQIDKLPSTERNMVNIERQFKFNDAIYNFLYQKRSEAEIAKNAALPDHKVIDKALVGIRVAPKSSLNYLIAFIVGLLIPGLYVFIRYITKDTIDSKDDLAKISDAPIFGYIPEFPKEYNRMIVFDKPRSQITEAYRTIRTNIKYVLNDMQIDGGSVILLTSSMPGEGKSITSFNIASVLSISGNKTLLIEYDLRKPRLAKMLNLNTSIGISTYFIGQTSIEDSVQHTEFDNLDVLAVGPVPPNPSEIVDSQKNKDLIKELRKRYEYIILDTPPVNLIADAQTLAKESDISLYLIRLGITSSSILSASLVEMEQRSGVKVKFILNGIKTIMQKYGYGKAGGGYGYGGYGRYGYGYGGYGKYGGYGGKGSYGYGYGYGDYLKEYSFGYFEDETQGLKRTKQSAKANAKNKNGVNKKDAK
ncbi:MAG: polysaccharide biosynthesis tyrosine autokinase [Bacteroidales bacterium]|nr:polysaccharide biosynthesis tyrosine autokinase [Bacteroidales bacterium]